ncbi:hypothetical protein D1007_56977 [Hordeum vulgare]|nr:hypothetical protein D1007_56977 [Hordeum vulgare]
MCTSPMSFVISSADSEVDGCGIVQFQSEFFLPTPTFNSLKERSKYYFVGHGLTPACRVLGVQQAPELLDECQCVVWIDHPASEHVGQAFEELHGGLQHSWIKESRLERNVVDLSNKNKKMQVKLKKRNELMETMVFLIVLVSSIVAHLASIWSKQAN